MQITLENPDYRYICRGVSASGVRVNDREISTSFLLGPNVLVENWPLTDIGTSDPEVWEAVLALKPSLFILGTGDIQIFPEPKRLAFFLQRGIGFEVMNNAAAARTFNILAQEGRNVVAGFIISR
ncbi:MAG: Mth938-like domain-containing protein [Arenimonas sp.]|uniref:Mth938-like domain-containing protein n=1 Tax=Arenimonas sp. TaxID=1872635 RepID=UPI003C0739EA